LSVAIADLNGDGRRDLAVANFGDPLIGGDGTISVFLGDSNGTFSAATQYPTGAAGPQSVAIGDLNGDGRLDLAVAHGSNRISVLLGNDGGGFQTLTPSSVAFGDLNGDGRLDLAVANFGVDTAAGAGTTVSVLYSRGDGTFAVVTHNTLGTNPSSVAIGDLNGDGQSDLAVANAGSNTVSVFMNDGIGNLVLAATPYATGTDPSSVAIGDLNGDGRLDLAVANAGSNTVSVLLGNVGGGFQSQTQYATGTDPSSVAIADLNGDGQLDLAVANAGSNNITILLNTSGSINDAPVAVDDSYTTDEDTTLTISVGAGLLTNDSDANDDPLTVALVSGPAHGGVTLNADGSFSYTPDANYNGLTASPTRSMTGRSTATSPP
jgi:hypothetical protein